ncbi:MAG: hypothetical protein NC344_01755 [Bacteroidales bacterium]|nr:hypothetical protein [Bacteroidales bacterium]MCM1146559.1 hypothetical protein [Bacteroidales bacterium]MCM1205951.1 hypothetical protein [Bacillota bacterium]MCM1510169.1 hypothetical protein [Clostridium sp.]
MRRLKRTLVTVATLIMAINANAYRWQSPYAYCSNSPVNCVDPDGRKIVFVNGYLGFGSPNGGAVYWNGSNSSFVKGAQYTFNDYATPFFTN